MKYSYKEIRKIDSTAIRSLCIEKNWFTLGDNEDYEELLNYEKKDNITTDEIVEMATIILSNSDTDYEITSIMCELSMKCYTFFDEV